MSLEFGITPPDQFEPVAHVTEVLPVQATFAAFAVGTEEKTSPKKAALTVRK